MLSVFGLKGKKETVKFACIIGAEDSEKKGLLWSGLIV